MPEKGGRVEGEVRGEDEGVQPQEDPRRKGRLAQRSRGGGGVANKEGKRRVLMT